MEKKKKFPPPLATGNCSFAQKWTNYRWKWVKTRHHTAQTFPTNLKVESLSYKMSEFKEKDELRRLVLWADAFFETVDPFHRNQKLFWVRPAVPKSQILHVWPTTNTRTNLIFNHAVILRRFWSSPVHSTPQCLAWTWKQNRMWRGNLSCAAYVTCSHRVFFSPLDFYASDVFWKWKKSKMCTEQNDQCWNSWQNVHVHLFTQKSGESKPQNEFFEWKNCNQEIINFKWALHKWSSSVIYYWLDDSQAKAGCCLHVRILH